MITTVSVVMCDDENDQKLNLTKRSASLSYGCMPERVSRADLAGFIDRTNAEAFHVQLSGMFIMPEFCPAMNIKMESTGKDFVICRCAVLKEENPFVADGANGLFSAQVVIRKWVLKELGAGGHWEDLIKRIVYEYRGAEVSSVLCAVT